MPRSQTIQKQRRPLAKLDPLIDDYIHTVEVQNMNTADTYRFRLYPFVYFLKERRYNLKELIQSIKDKKRDLYNLLSDYASYLSQKAKKNDGRGQTSIKRRVSVVKLLFIFHDIEINEVKFKQKVRLPRNVRRERTAIDKSDIRKVLLACEDKRVRLYLLLIAGTGMRAREALSLKFRNIQLEATPPRINIDGEYTKTKTDRFVYLTNEFVKEFKEYTIWRHRQRRLYNYDRNNEGHEHLFTPIYREDDLIFSIPHRDPKLNAAVESLYREMLVNVNKVIDRIGLGEKDAYTGIRKINRISFRRFVKTTISDLGYSDYSEWFIGHAHASYWEKKESEKAELFTKIEPYLTFLDFEALETHGKDFATQSQELDNLRNKVNRLERIIVRNQEKTVNKLSNKRFSIEEIADALGVSPDAVSEQIYRRVYDIEEEPPV